MKRHKSRLNAIEMRFLYAIWSYLRKERVFTSILVYNYEQFMFDKPILKGVMLCGYLLSLAHVEF